jgi:hypothetical protein
MALVAVLTRSLFYVCATALQETRREAGISISEEMRTRRAVACRSAARKYGPGKFRPAVSLWWKMQTLTGKSAA